MLLVGRWVKKFAEIHNSPEVSGLTNSGAGKKDVKGIGCPEHAHWVEHLPP